MTELPPLSEPRCGAEAAAASARERQRIAHDLHDGLGQLLGGIALKAQTLGEALGEEGSPHAAEAEEIVRLVNEAIGHTRLLAKNLDPVVPASEPLGSALTRLARDTTRLFRKVDCVYEGDPALSSASPHAAQHLFRVAQEAINNAIRHGRATCITLRLAADDAALTLAVEDNGTGIDPAKPSSGIGIRIMRHRLNAIGGGLEIQPNPGGGARFICRVPHDARA